MLLTKIYNKKEATEEAWFDSSMVVYSKMIEDPNNNFGELFLTYKGGNTYVYHNVLFEDYVVFVAGGTEGSHGKAINRIIKGRYEYEKVESQDVSMLEERRQEIIKKQYEEQMDINNTYFISGHRDITEEEFISFYEPLIEDTYLRNPDAKFIIGDYIGCDIMAQNFLLDMLEVSPEQITVYHMGNTPANFNKKVCNFVGGFKTDEERDSAMTKASLYDIAFVRDHTKWSGTGQNILRRHTFLN